MTSIEGYDAYRYYKTLRFHFNQKSFDAVKYGYKTKIVSHETYLALGRQSLLFDKLARQFRTRIGLHRYLVCQFYWNPNAFIAELCDLEFDKNMERWLAMKRFLRSPDYHIKNDIDNLLLSHKHEDILYGDDFKLPIIITHGMKHTNHCTYITAALLAHTNWAETVNARTSNIIWDMTRDRLNKLSPFVMGSKDPAKYKRTMSVLNSIL